ncbi:MAG TPA: flagellar motor switch protein FliM [Patescibacteria group bacterium]|jgi:flagellar motor switch protein FliM|nr:flagellar motor switch protein FliM [Patescibacteria group bacterium]
MSPANPTASAQTPETAGDEVLVLNAKGKRERKPASSVRGHDFRQSGFLAPSELRRIRLRHEQFIRSLAARLAIFLRLELTVQLAKLQIISYQKLTESLSNQIHITLFRTDPLKGVGLLVLSPRLGLCLVDRLLGGVGQMPESARDLSEIEIALTDQLAMLVLSEWCNHWPEMKELRPVLLGHENNSRFLQTAPPDTSMLILTMDAGIGDQLEPLQLIFPYATVEPLMRQLSPALPEADVSVSRPAQLAWNSEFDDVKVKASAQWQGLRIPAAEIARMKQGDVLMLAPECSAQVQLRLSHIPKFMGRPGTCGGKWAVQLTGLLPA